MKTPKLPLVAMITLMALPGSGAAIETVSESFVGSVTTIPGVQGAAERISLFSLRVVRPAIYAGKVSSVGTAAISDSSANWTSGLFAGRGALYAEFDSGVEADIQQVNFTLNSLSFSGTLPPSITPGLRYRIREHHTVAEIFGTVNQAGLLAGLNSTEAETVRHFIPETQQTRTYFYMNYPGFTGWVSQDYSPASNIVIYPEQGLMLRRLTAANLTLTSSGPLKSGPTVIPILPGHNLLGLYGRATPVRLDQLNLLAAGFVGAENPTSGDNIRKFNPDGTSVTYFYFNLSGYEGWYNAQYSPANDVTLAPGTLFILYRRAPSQFFEWTLPPQ
jgi:hypothetical protein